MAHPGSGTAQSGARTRMVRCPGCGGASVYGPENPCRPFCSARCKQIDLGAWANEEFRMPDPDPPGQPQPPHAPG